MDSNFEFGVTPSFPPPPPPPQALQRAEEFHSDCEDSDDALDLPEEICLVEQHDRGSVLLDDLSEQSDHDDQRRPSFVPPKAAGPLAARDITEVDPFVFQGFGVGLNPTRAGPTARRGAPLGAPRGPTSFPLAPLPPPSTSPSTSSLLAAYVQPPRPAPVPPSAHPDVLIPTPPWLPRQQ